MASVNEKMTTASRSPVSRAPQLEQKELPHNEALKHARELVARLLADPCLQDLPGDVTGEEVASLLALEQGHAITVNLKRYDEQVLRKYITSTGENGVVDVF